MAVKEDGRRSGEDEGKSNEAEVAEVGRIGVVGEEAISESWLSSSQVLVFLAAGVGAGGRQ